MQVYKFECENTTLLSDNIILFSETTVENRITGREVEGRGASDYSFAVNLFCVTWDRENVLLLYAY